MSQENVESPRRSNDAFSRGDRTAWLSTLDPDAETLPARKWPEDAPIHGRDAIWDYYVAVTEAWQVGSVELGEIISRREPTRLVFNAPRHALGRASGADLTFSYWNLSTYRDGKAIRIEWFADRAEALEAAAAQELILR